MSKASETLGYARGLLKAMEKYGVAVSGLATGRIYGADGFSLGSSDESNRQEALRRMLAYRLYLCSDRSLPFPEFDNALTRISEVNLQLRAFASKEDAVAF